MAILLPSVYGCFRRDSPVNFAFPSNPNTVVKDFISVSKGGNNRRRIRVGVCSRIRELEPVILSDATGNSNAAAPTPTPTPVKRSKENEERRNRHVNIGYAIRTLREEFPEMFYREMSFEIYRDDIIFEDPIHTSMGIDNYKSIFSALRFHGNIFFKALWVDVVSIWQPVGPSTVMIRWTVHGIPRVPWETRGRFDGTSEYKLDKQGKIYEHRVHNVALNRPPKFQVLSVNDLIRSLGCPSAARPTYFEAAPTPWTSPCLAAAPEPEPEPEPF